jgi:hypothetical protein
LITLFYGTAAVGRGYIGTLWPTAFDAKATVTLVGGTVVATSHLPEHRLIDGG